MTRLPAGGDIPIGTPAATDSVVYVQLSDGTLRRVTITNLIDTAGTQASQTITTLSTTTIEGIGDTNTTIVFGDDSVVGTMGGVEFVRLVESTQDATTFNNGAVDLDFTVKKLTSGNAFNYDAGTDAVTLNGATVGITGAVGITGVMTLDSPNVYDINTTITAFATGGQASATALTGEFNNVTTCATAGDSVKLLTAVLGQTQIVKNSGAATLAIFPNTSDSIDALGVNLSVNCPVGCIMTFRAISATVWETQETFYSSAPTTLKGGFEFKAVDNSADYTVTLSNAAFGQASVVSIPDVGAATGTLAALEATQTFTGTKTFGAINRYKATNAITAFATGGQASGTLLTSENNSITVCATAGDSVRLPTSVAGMRIQVSNLGAAYANVFPISGDLIDALAANTAVSLPVGASIIFTCAVAGSWKATAVPYPAAKFTTAADVTTFAAGVLSGAAHVVHHNTQGTPGSVAFRTAAEMFADDPYARVGGAYLLTIVNAQGSGTLTVTGGASGITLTGTATIAANTSRDFVVTYTSASALVIQNGTTGVFS